MSGEQHTKGRLLIFSTEVRLVVGSTMKKQGSICRGTYMFCMTSWQRFQSQWLSVMF